MRGRGGCRESYPGREGKESLGETFCFEKAWKGGCWRSVAELVGWRVQRGEEGWRGRKELAICSGHSMSKVCK